MAPQPSMHHCLKVPELFAAICDFSEDRELYNLARTCREFCPCALDVLWHDPSQGIDALLRCFPAGVIEVAQERIGLTKKQFSVLKIPEAHEWDRVRLDTSRMKVLRIGDTPRRNEPTDGCYHLFLEHCPYTGKDIFPNMQSVLLDDAAYLEPGSLLCATIAQACSLRRLEIVLPWVFNPKQIERCFDASGDSLACLRIDYGAVGLPELTQLADCINDNLCKLRALRNITLYFFPLSSKALSHLASLPNLKTLSFMYTNEYTEPQLLAPHANNFHNLTALKLHIEATAPLDETIVLITNLHSAVLEQIHIVFEREPLVARLFDLLHALARFHSLRTLTFVGDELDVPYEWCPDDPEEWPIPCSSLLSAISPLTALRTLDIGGIPLHVTSADIASVSRLWLDLDTVDLSGVDEYTTTTIRAADLRSLATGCLHLRSILLAILGGTPPTVDVYDTICENRNVRFLGLCPRGGRPAELEVGDMDILQQMFPDGKILLFLVNERE